ncbi:MAG: hypothetical protein U9O49_01860, partial [Candidatus Thermoplasmatota archaeon]|nr:hypothetical protein [Candidatus Thermoplasmatota archaeon]
MKKNDKLIVILGVVILVTASVGVYVWTPGEGKEALMKSDELAYISGVLMHPPDAITVSDSCPFYPLIATPLAVHYNSNGEQEVMPLYIENIEDPSAAITKVESQIERLDDYRYMIDDSRTAEELSLDIAKEFWESSDAALLIEDDESGYNLGVIATPIASYLSIPVIVTDEVDSEVTEVLTGLGVKHTIVCGENLEGYGSVLEFKTVEEIVDAQIDLLMDKFGDINYLTLTNPVDAFPPKVLDSVEKHFGSSSEEWSFTIPNDYKYALIKIEASADEPLSFTIGADLEDIHPVLQEKEVTDGGPATPKRD